MVLYNFEESLDYGGTGNSFANGNSYNNYWPQIAESSLPLTSSKLASATRGQFQASIEAKSREISSKVILVNFVSLLINLLLAVIAFYFSFTNDSTATTAFAADCLLDLISSAILLWRYHGDLNSVYMHAREQIACIYLGALFELSAIGIIIKSISDFTTFDASPVLETESKTSYELVYLAISATVACTILTAFKCALFKTLRDNSILLDVINTVISTVFAMSIVLSQVLINVNPSFWYLDPVLSVILAVFMMGFGIKVIHQNFNILKPIYCGNHSGDRTQHNLDGQSSALILMDISKKTGGKKLTNGKYERLSNNYGTNLANATSSDQTRPTGWQMKDHSSITFN